MFYGCISSYFNIFRLLRNYQENFINNKNYQDTTIYIFYLISLY